MISRHLFRQVIVFGIIGVVATFVHYSVATALAVMNIVSIYLANLAGYLCAVSISYFGHNKFTFQVEHSRTLLVKFVSVSVIVFTCSELILLGLEHCFHLPHAISLAVVVLTIPVISFIMNKFWVYCYQDEGSLNQA